MCDVVLLLACLFRFQEKRTMGEKDRVAAISQEGSVSCWKEREE